MANVIVNGTGLVRGIPQDEVGINIASFTVRYFPQYKEKLPNKNGQHFAFAVPDAPSRDVTVQGEINSGSGLMAATFIASYVFANTVNTFGGDTGGLYMDEVTTTLARAGWFDLNVKFSSDPATT